MLYENDVPVKLNAAQIKTVETYFHNKFPVKVIYPPGRVVKSRLKHNIKPDKPCSISFDLKARVKTDAGIEIWRYAENVIIEEKGNKRYLPKKFMYQGVKYLDRGDIELIYFLLNKSEYCKGGMNEGPMVKFMFEDLVTEAEKKVAVKKIQTKIDNLLYGDDFGLTEEKIRAVATAYFVPNVDTLRLAQVKIILNEKINATKEGPEEFFRMVNADEEIKARVSLQKTSDKGIIKHDGVKKAWFWKGTGDNKDSLICKVPTNKSPNEALYEYYLGNDGFRDDIDAVLITNKPKKEGVTAE